MFLFFYAFIRLYYYYFMYPHKNALYFYSKIFLCVCTFEYLHFCIKIFLYLWRK